MPTTQQLREQRANIWSQMTEIMEIADKETDGVLTGEQTKKYDELEASLDAKGDEVSRAERHERNAAALNKPNRDDLAPVKDDKNGAPARKVDTPEYARAFEAYIRFGQDRMNAADKQLLATGFVAAQDDNTPIQNALGVGSGSAGGYTVPPEFRNEIIERLMKTGAVRQVAEHLETDSGVNLPWPTLDDTGNEGAILSENTQVSQQDIVFGQASLNAWMYTSKMVLVSLQLLQDAGFAVNQKLPGWLANRIARVQNRHFTVGTGTSQPLGIASGAAVGVTGATGQTTSVIYDNFIDLIDSIDPAYLEGGNCKWMLGQSMRKVVRKLKDGQNRPLWEPSLQNGIPDTLLSYPMVLNNHMPVPAASAKSLLFGDFEQGYVIRDVSDVQVLRLTERYADFLQVGFLAFQRSDGTVQNTNAYSAYQNSAT